MLNVINLILGGFLLFAGRKLFWLFVAVLGFILGLQLASRFWSGSESVAVLIGLIVGIIFALLAVFLQRIAVTVAGFLAGGYIMAAFTNMLGMDRGAVSWVVYIIGGIIGVVLIMLLFDWALIALSSLAGAALIVQSFFSQPGVAGIIFLLLMIAGIIIQSSVLRREKR